MESKRAKVARASSNAPFRTKRRIAVPGPMNAKSMPHLVTGPGVNRVVSRNVSNLGCNGNQCERTEYEEVEIQHLK